MSMVRIESLKISTKWIRCLEWESAEETRWKQCCQGPRYPSVMANALMDWLAHNADQISIEGESYRKKLSPKSDNLDSKKSVN